MTRKSILGIDFLDTMKAFLMPQTNTMCIMETGQQCVIPVMREIKEGKMPSTPQVSKGFKEKKPTFLATLKMEEEPKIVQAPKAIHRVFEEIKDVIPAKLPKRLPPRREVDHSIELELRAKPPPFTP